MRSLGLSMWASGLVLFLFAAFFFDPSVETETPYAAPGGGLAYEERRTVNSDLQQRQMLLAMAGLTLFLAGVVVHASGLVLGIRETPAPDRTLRRTTLISEVPPPPPEAAEEDADTLMSRHGIRQEGDYFLYQSFRYAELKDAVNYAKAQEKRG